MQILVALCLLYWQVKWAFLAGLAVVIAIIPCKCAPHSMKHTV